jgi:hypothetical protein
MWKRRRLCFLCVTLFCIGPVQALRIQVQRKTLLPAPQRIQYGTQTVPVRGFSIQLPQNCAPEDQFAAEELSALLHARTGARFPVAGDTASTRVVALVRTGGIDSLPPLNQVLKGQLPE